MPGRDPEARQRSQKVADEIRAEMAKQGLTGAALRRKLEEAGVEVPNDMWMTRRLNGDVNLVTPVKIVYGPTADLERIAEVLKVDPKRFVRILNKTSKTEPAAA